MVEPNRRLILAGLSAPFAFAALRADDRDIADPIGFGFGTYGMKSLSTMDALRVCADIGYDGVELALMQGWPTQPSLLSKQDRREIHDSLAELDLTVPSLLESLPCLRSDKQHLANIEKLKRATELAHDVSPDKPPVVQSIVGARTGQWERSKHRLVNQLADWADVGRQSQTTVCFKPHASHAVHTPERALWIHRQVDSPWLKVVYDYSHFSLEGLPLAASLKQLLPITAYVQIKDSRGTPKEYEYLLPGAGETDYLKLLSVLKEASYNGFVSVEVSSHIHRKPGYDPVSTARTCYQRLAPLFAQLGLNRT